MRTLGSSDTKPESTTCNTPDNSNEYGASHASSLQQALLTHPMYNDLIQPQAVRRRCTDCLLPDSPGQTRNANSWPSSTARRACVAEGLGAAGMRARHHHKPWVTTQVSETCYEVSQHTKSGEGASVRAHPTDTLVSSLAPSRPLARQGARQGAVAHPPAAGCTALSVSHPR